jgi:uncharacterized protein (DUF2252 family)
MNQIVLEHGPATHREATDERERGRALRSDVPRNAHAEWNAPEGRDDPVAVLLRDDVARSADLVPIRHGRMAADPFAFYRGSAAIMTADLATTPRSGLATQLCGDAHLSNFGVFASPERQLLFDLNDFDETLPGPWEWDLKRLATSVAVAARESGAARRDGERAARSSVASYREAMRSFADAGPLDTWYARINADDVARAVTDRGISAKSRSRMDAALQKARSRTSTRAVRKLTTVIDGRPRFVDAPPLVVSLETIAGPERAADLAEQVRAFFAGYRSTLPHDRQQLLSQFDVVDIAHKVVGVGSVGMRAFIVLLAGRNGSVLVLQVKEAAASALEAFLGPSGCAVPGQRVVEGQRLMQAASDLFLGWSTSEQDGRHYYWRQLADMKGSADIGAMSPAALAIHARLCGWTLARAHARSGSPEAMAGYLGGKPVLDRAIAAFASAYADQNDADFEAYRQAIADGRVEARADG